jgi:hypothetical protein
LDWDKSEDVSPEDNYVIPVSFGKEHKSMSEHTYQLLTKGKIAIPKEFNKLESALRNAWSIGFDLDKDQTMYDDSLDSLGLMLKGVRFKGVDE